MKKDISPKTLELFINKLLDRKPSWYDDKKEVIEKVFLFILENDLIEPTVETVTFYDDYFGNVYNPPIDEELNFSWDFYHPELDGLVYIDSGFTDESNTFCYYIKLGEKVRFEMNENVKEFCKDVEDLSNPFPEEVLKYLRKI
jgi:hypothetical protein